MSDRRFLGSQPSNQTLSVDLNRKSRPQEEVGVPMQTLALDLCRSAAEEASWSDSNNDICGCRPDLKREDATHWQPCSSKSGLWDSCERKYGSADSIPGTVRSSETCRNHTSLDCYSLNVSRNCLQSCSSKSNEFRCRSGQKEETPLDILLHKLRPSGAYFHFKKKRKREPKSLVRAFQSISMSEKKEDNIVPSESEKDRKSLLTAFQGFTISDVKEKDDITKLVDEQPSTENDAYDLNLGHSIAAM